MSRLSLGVLWSRVNNYLFQTQREISHSASLPLPATIHTLTMLIKVGAHCRKEYKGRTDSNSPTGLNEAVRVATLLL